jgi:hypothetical protein
MFAHLLQFIEARVHPGTSCLAIVLLKHRSVGMGPVGEQVIRGIPDPLVPRQLGANGAMETPWFHVYANAVPRVQRSFYKRGM